MDEPRVLLSRLVCAGSEQLADLPQPLFYYIALGLVGAGMVAIIASLIGWWATCLNTYCTFSLVSPIITTIFYSNYIQSKFTVFHARSVTSADRIRHMSADHLMASVPWTKS